MMWTLAVLGVSISLQLPRMPPWIAVITLIPFAWRVCAEWRDWPPLPGIVRIPALAIALLALFFSYGEIFGRTAAVSLLALMLCIKLLETYKIRDARVIVSFCLFLCVTQYLFDQGVLMPIYGALVVATSLIALSHLHRREAFRPRDEVPMLGKSIFSELKFSFRVLLLALPAAVALFLLFPRWTSPLWGVPESTLDAKTGLSDRMSPGTIQQLFMDDGAAFRVEFHGPVPSPAELYWRGPVFWDYDGREWTTSFWSRNIEARQQPEPNSGRFHYTVQLEPNERRWLFALDYPTRVPQGTRLTLDYQLYRDKAVTQLLRYDMSSDPTFRDSPTLSEVLKNSALDLPPDLNPRTRELVADWRRDLPSDEAFAQRILRHFREEPFHYTLNPPLLGYNTVDDFLFSTRQGYCEHYASAFTVMMRMAGVPARVVTGYQGGWYNEFGDYLLVKQSDAHAWSEIWLEGRGWTRVDPTAAVSPLRVQSGSFGAITEPRHVLDYAWFRSIRNGFDVVQRGWNDWVIDFGAAEQKRLFAPLGMPEMGPAALVGVLVVVFIAISLALLPVILRIQGPMARSPLQKAWQRFLRRLEKAGVEITPAMGASSIAETASRKLASQSGEIDHIARLYNLYRYSPTPPDLKEITATVSSFRPKARTA